MTFREAVEAAKQKRQSSTMSTSASLVNKLAKGLANGAVVVKDKAIEKAANIYIATNVDVLVEKAKTALDQQAQAYDKRHQVQ